MDQAPSTSADGGTGLSPTARGQYMLSFENRIAATAIFFLLFAAVALLLLIGLLDHPIATYGKSSCSITTSAGLASMERGRVET